MSIWRRIYLNEVRTELRNILKCYKEAWHWPKRHSTRSCTRDVYTVASTRTVLHTAVTRLWTKSVHGRGTGSCTESCTRPCTRPLHRGHGPRPPPCTDRAHGGVQGPYLGLRPCTRAAYMCTAATRPGTGRVPGKIRPRVHGSVETRAVYTGRVRAVCTVLYTVVYMAVHTVQLHGYMSLCRATRRAHGRVEGRRPVHGCVRGRVHAYAKRVHGRGHGPATVAEL